MALKVFLDEDVHSFIAEALRHRGWEALTTAEAGRLGTTDTEQLRWAAAGGYVFLTYNVRDFPKLHYELVHRGENHAGLIVGTQDDPRANLRAVLRILSTFDASDLVGQLMYLNNWMDGMSTGSAKSP